MKNVEPSIISKLSLMLIIMIYFLGYVKKI